ncbi:MAG TPA: aspartate aminotransferase family protein [Actinomycetota bacterium]|nr:aspartate aminotransferase family protein [Actinomycetota bacterium]
MRGPGEFDWHPEPELVGYRDPTDSRAALEALGAAAWALGLDYLYEEAMRRPVGPDPYGELRRRFFGDGPASPPEAATPAAEILAEVRERLVPHLYNAYHPGSFSYFTPPPLAMSIAGEVLAQWMNQGVDVWSCGPAAAFVEEEVIAWLRELVGYGEASFGILTPGGTLANVMALTIARDLHLAKLIGSAEPPRGTALEGARLYASDQAHFSIARALDLLGFPPETLRTIPSDERFRLEADAVADAILEDRAAGLTPLAIAAVSGSTNTGSVDALADLADVAEREGLWLHADAAYGGAARLSARDAWRVPDLARADSVTIDPHKWFFQAYDVGGLLVKRREDLRDTFHREPEYYGTGPREKDESLHWYQYSLESTRRFRALKLWLSWKHLGTEGLGRLVACTVDLASHLARRCRESNDLEALPEEPELSVVCFRHLPGGDYGPEVLDRYQIGLQRALEVSGEGWVSTTTLRGRTYLRAGIVNYLATDEDVDRVIAALRRLSPAVAAETGIRDR